MCYQGKNYTFAQSNRYGEIYVAIKNQSAANVVEYLHQFGITSSSLQKWYTIVCVQEVCVTFYQVWKNTLRYTSFSP